MRWIRNTAGQFELVVVPLHGRGNQGTTGAGVRILAYQRPDDSPGAWRTELIDGSLHATHNFDVIKWTEHLGDELLVAAKEGVIHFVKHGTAWQSSALPGVATGGVQPGAGEVREDKLAEGGKFVATIEPMHGNQLAVYTETKGSGASGVVMCLKMHSRKDTHWTAVTFFMPVLIRLSWAGEERIGKAKWA